MNDITITASQRTGLPIYAKRNEMIELIKSNQVVVVIGETGSGKSTQIPQYLYEAGYGTVGRIACTQPRRIAAKALATRVAMEVGCELGDKVGYQIRFDNTTSASTIISYMTDGVLLHEMTGDNQASRYSAVVLDEAHQRNLQTDILFGLFKSVLKIRPNLRIIVTSATLESKRFSEYFNCAPILNVTGRMYPVDTFYLRGCIPIEMVSICVETVERLHANEGAGDILVFLAGRAEIERCTNSLSRHSNLHIVPCYASLTIEEQYRALDPAPIGKRKVVLATNVAETSLTIDGIVYVVDSGQAKVNEFNPDTSINSLNLQSISASEAEQRKGRAGRIQKGQVHRLYTEDYYNKMPKNRIPDIQRRHLDPSIILLIACGVENVYQFDFIDPPSQAILRKALENLQTLGALTPNYKLTALGKEMTTFPVDPRLAKILVTSSIFECSEEIIKIVSILSAKETAGDLHQRPIGQVHEADLKRARFFKVEGDYVSFLHVYDSWVLNQYSKPWCGDTFVNYQLLEEAKEIQKQLTDVFNANKANSSMTCDGQRPRTGLSKTQRIIRTLASGFPNQIAKRTSRFAYRCSNNPKKDVFIFPGSSIFNKNPDWLFYEEIMFTGKKTYLKHCTMIEETLAKEMAPQFYEKIMGHNSNQRRRHYYDYSDDELYYPSD